MKIHTHKERERERGIYTIVGRREVNTREINKERKFEEDLPNDTDGYYHQADASARFAFNAR